MFDEKRSWITKYMPFSVLMGPPRYMDRQIDRQIDRLLKLHRSQRLNYAIIYKNFTILENYK